MAGMTSTVPWSTLGHDVYQHVIPFNGLTVNACRKCSCWEGSEAGQWPCGDQLGATVARRATIRNGRHSWDFVWDGRVIGTSPA